MQTKKIRRIACVGAGVIGSSWAAYFLLRGLDVTIQDISEQVVAEAGKNVFAHLEAMAESGVVSAEPIGSLRARLSCTTSIAEAVKDADFIQESTRERYEIKRQVIEEVDRHAGKDVIFSSSSSGLLVSKLQGYSVYPGRIIVGHPFNPPHLIPLVEIVRGQADEVVVRQAYDFYHQIGKRPIIVNKEVPGHVANRIQAALWREAIDLVMKGVCSVEDVDAAVAYGPGLRWALLGPHMIFNLGAGEGGIEAFFQHYSAAFETWWEDMAAWRAFPEGCRDVIKEGLKEEMGGRSLPEVEAWRDEKLMSILRILDCM
ncbi:MAG: 3-hydroxyacyl-CoA dehydrogenase NAD-binding domain-containing protein [Bacillota bacterium]